MGTGAASGVRAGPVGGGLRGMVRPARAPALSSSPTWKGTFPSRAVQEAGLANTAGPRPPLQRHTPGPSSTCVFCILPGGAPRPAVRHARQPPHNCPARVRRPALQGARLPWGLPQDSPGCLGEQGARKGLRLHSTPRRKVGVAQRGPRTRPLLQPSRREWAPCARCASEQLRGRVEALRGLNEHMPRAWP